MGKFGRYLVTVLWLVGSPKLLEYLWRLLAPQGEMVHAISITHSLAGDFVVLKHV